jgi:cholesterol transport system auxiliary component
MTIRTHKRFLIVSVFLVFAMTACVSVNKTKQNLEVYDFGLFVPNESNQQITSKILLEKLVVADALNINKIRYRLNYQNPSRVFYYTESRWATTPSELLWSKASQIINYTKTPINCSLKLRIEAFDHVFQTTADSEGVVQLRAFVVEKNSQKIIRSQLITEKVTSVSPNAQGGTAALQLASEAVLKKAVEWGNMTLDESELCH